MPPNEGKHYRFARFEFFAERGMISLIDTELAADSGNTEQYHWRISASEFIKRAIAAYMQEPDKYESKRRQLRQMLDDAKTACKLAKAQGDPTDPSVLDHVVKHRRKKSVLVLPHELPPMPGTVPLKIRQKGRTPADTLRDGLTVTPDLTIGSADMLTPRRAERMRQAVPTRR